MRDYWKRLKEHPGTGVANMMILLGAIAGGGNRSIDNPWIGMLFGAVFAGSISWSVVLVSNFKK